MFTDLREVPGLGIVHDIGVANGRQAATSGDFETHWQTALHDGVVAGTRAAARTVTLNSAWQSHLSDMLALNSDATAIELVFVPDPSIYDGRFANNGWLQELPKPISKLAWGNAAMMSPATAERLGLEMGNTRMAASTADITCRWSKFARAKAASAPLWIMPGHADDTVTLTWATAGNMPAASADCRANRSALIPIRCERAAALVRRRM